MFVYSLDLVLVRTIRWEKDGWGLAHNGTHLFASDGTSTIYVVDKDFQLQSKITVKENGRPVIYLNELEYYKGFLLANIYYQPNVVMINITSGEVVAKYNAAALAIEEVEKHRLQGDEVLNGIAYDEKTNRLLLTGKNWGQIYEIPTSPFDLK